MVKIYVHFHSEAESNESLNDKARAAFKAIEDGSEEHVELWKWFREISIAEFKRILSVMKVDFDSWDGESFYNDKMEPVIKELNFDGETSCYIQYTYARICSVLRKAGIDKASDIDYSLLTDDDSYEIIKLLSQFPQIVENAANEYEPSTISKYLIDLVQSFNKFYHDSPILSSEGKLRDSRIELCKDVKLVINIGMSLLGIECPDRM